MSHVIFVNFHCLKFFRVGFSDMPHLNIKVIPTYGVNEYSNVFIQELLSAKIRTEFKVREELFDYSNEIDFCL